MYSHTKRRTASSGFTLIDVMITMAIISLVLSATISIGARQLNKLRHHHDVSQTYHMLQHARSLAMSQDQDIIIHNTGRHSQYSIATPHQHLQLKTGQIRNEQTYDLGFKSNGNSKRSGKIQIQNGPLTSSISIAPGSSPLRIR